MGVRYLFNSSGQYVAFVSGHHVFDTDCEWLGFIANGNEMYDTRGQFIGYVLDDDRVAKRLSEIKMPKLVPFKPFKPMRPFNPLRRLRMAPLPLGYVDIFESRGANHPQSVSNQDYANRAAFPRLLGMHLYADDGTFLGVINKNRFDQTSLTNEYGPYGSPYSQTSIFNQYGQYGSEYSRLSPFNPYTTTPPHFQDASGRHMGRLSVNKFLDNCYDTSEFVTWLKS